MIYFRCAAHNGISRLIELVYKIILKCKQHPKMLNKYARIDRKYESVGKGKSKADHHPAHPLESHCGVVGCVLD